MGLREPRLPSRCAPARPHWARAPAPSPAPAHGLGARAGDRPSHGAPGCAAWRRRLPAPAVVGPAGGAWRAGAPAGGLSHRASSGRGVHGRHVGLRPRSLKRVVCAPAERCHCRRHCLLLPRDLARLHSRRGRRCLRRRGGGRAGLQCSYVHDGPLSRHLGGLHGVAHLRDRRRLRLPAQPVLFPLRAAAAGHSAPRDRGLDGGVAQRRSRRRRCCARGLVDAVERAHAHNRIRRDGPRRRRRQRTRPRPRQRMVGPPRSPRHCGGAAFRGGGRGRAPAHRHGPALVARQRRAHHGRRHLPRRVLRDGAGDPGVVLGRLQPLFVGHYIRRSRRTACGRDALVAGRAARARAARRAHPGRLSLRADGRAIRRRLWGQQRRVGAPLASGRLPRRRHHPPAPLREPLRRRHGRPGQPPQRQGDRVPDVRRPRRRLRV